MDIGQIAPGTSFTLDAFGRYICNTFDEARANSDPMFRAAASDVNGKPLPSPSATIRPFDFIIIGGGTFGGALAEHLHFRSTGRSERILVLEAGPFLIPEHMQNLPSLGLGTEAWGVPWNADQSLSYQQGLLFALGGRSLAWGGWSPRPLDAEMSAWPPAVVADLNAQTLPSGDPGYYRQSGQQLGVTIENDFMFGALHTALREQLYQGLRAGKVSSAVPLGTLPAPPPVELRLPSSPNLTELAALLGVPPQSPLPTGATAASLATEYTDKLKLEAPLAVRASAEHAGFFPLNKFSSIPLLMKAARLAYAEFPGDDVRKRVMIVPRTHVTRLAFVDDNGQKRVVSVDTERGSVPVAPDAKVIVALGTVESTRLALLSFGADGKTGANLIAHLRSNVNIRVPRAALDSRIVGNLSALQSSALFVKGAFPYTKPGTGSATGFFHLQITASGLGPAGNNSEAELFQKVPDVDTLNQHLNASDSHVIITIRGIGEMTADNPASNVTLDLNPANVDFRERKAFVNLFPSARDYELWDAMDKATDDVAWIFSGGLPFELLTPSGIKQVKPGDSLKALLPYAPGRRDNLATTHHEAGTLRMGTDPATSVTDTECRVRGTRNCYVASPAIFPRLGSPNPMLTGIALARRLGDTLLPAPPPAPTAVSDPGFTTLFDGTQSPGAFFADWLMTAGTDASFQIVGRQLVARPSRQGIGLLFLAKQQFDDFTLRLDFCLPHARGDGNDNSGVFVRFRDPRLPALPGSPPPDVPGNAATIGVDTGYEIQIDEEARGDTRRNEPDGLFFNRTGTVYKVKALGTKPGQQDYRSTQSLAGLWHSYEIAVKGRTYTVLLNGQPSTTFTADASDPLEKWRGRGRSEDPQSGFIGLQAHTGNVAFANIRVRG